MGIIKSILDLDLYKITMLNAVLLKYPDFKVRIQFTDRGKVKFPKGFDKRIIRELIKLSKLKGISEDEANKLRKKVPYLSEVTIKYLKCYRFEPAEISVYQDADGYLHMNGEGFYHSLILWETILMSIVSELYFIDIPSDLEKVRQEAAQKSDHFYMNNQRVVEMGTRRRKSYAVHDAVIRGLFSGYQKSSMIGTSNVHFGLKYDLKIIGTVAHEWYMFHSALFGYKMANRMANDVWAEVYRGELGIALPDTFTTDVFLKTFDSFNAKLQDGLRQDSGDPVEWAHKVYEHYKTLRIDPDTKQYIFSDSINSFDAIDKLNNDVGFLKIKSYGIGTWLTNDFPEPALKMVIKLSGVFVNGEWVNVVKIGDGTGKESGNFEEITKCNMVLGLNKQKTLFD